MPPPAPDATTPFSTVQTSGSGTQQQQQQQQGTNSSLNTYDPAAMGVRGATGNLLQQLLGGGQLPAGLGMDQVAFDALNSNFNRYVKPGMAAQFGAGSTSIGSQQALMNEQLAAAMSQQRWGNAFGLLGAGQNFGYTPIGNSGQASSSMSGNGSQAFTQQSNNAWQSALLSALLSLMQGGGI